MDVDGDDVVLEKEEEAFQKFGENISILLLSQFPWLQPVLDKNTMTVDLPTGTNIS